MKILAISDRVVESVYSPQIREQYGDVDLVLGCGDLPYSYMEYVVSMLNVPCLYVHGNHDQPEYLSNGTTLTEPGGWIDVDGRVVRVNGLLVGGLEGAMGHKPNAPYLYTQQEMAYKVWCLAPNLVLNRLLYGRYLDILITHSPPFGIHDGEDVAHQGFKPFLGLMSRFHPRYLLHGHKHRNSLEPWRTRYKGTEVINVYPWRMIEWQ